MRRRIALSCLVGFALFPPGDVSAQGGPSHEQLHWDEYIRASFRALEEYGPRELDLLAELVNGAARLDAFVHADDESPRLRLYREFVVKAIEDAWTGDVLQAMFMNLVIHVTPPAMLVEIVVPELGQEGRLKKLLEQPCHDVFRRIQEQGSQGYSGRASFEHYVRYFRDNVREGFARCPNAQLVVGHMVATDVQEAFLAMLEIDYGFDPDGSMYREVAPQQRQEVRRLQLAHHTIGDSLFRRRYGFPEPEGLNATVASLLRDLSGHEKWWVRLYVAEVLRLQAPVREAAVVESLSADPHPLVRQAIATITEQTER